MHGLGAIDPGRTIDWGLTTEDYAKFRPGPPSSFYEKLKVLGVGLPNQSLLDLGTGTGVLAREFSKLGVKKVFGTDLSEVQVKMAAELAEKEGLRAEFQQASAEMQPFDDKEFDVVTANQCWLYFDKSKVIPFDRDSWRGRIRACRGVGAALSADEVTRFDQEHDQLLQEKVEDKFTVLHRIDAHILEPLD